MLHSGGNIITLQGDCLQEKGLDTILLWHSPNKWIVYLGLKGHHSLLKSRVMRSPRTVEKWIRKNIFENEEIHSSVFLQMECMNERMTAIYNKNKTTASPA